MKRRYRYVILIVLEIQICILIKQYLGSNVLSKQLIFQQIIQLCNIVMYPMNTACPYCTTLVSNNIIVFNSFIIH